MIRPTIWTDIQRISQQVRLSLKFERALIVGLSHSSQRIDRSVKLLSARDFSRSHSLVRPDGVTVRENLLPSHP